MDGNVVGVRDVGALVGLAVGLVVGKSYSLHLDETGRERVKKA